MPYAHLTPPFIALQKLDEAPHPDAGFVSLRKKNGKYLKVTPGGLLGESDSAGADEQFIKTGKGYVADRSGYPNGTIIGIVTL